jgi:hypothetical protein
MLEFDPQVSFDVGLKEMWDWAQEVGVRWSTTPQLEHRRHLPGFWK